MNSGATKRQAREQLLEAARRREIEVVLVWRLDRWGRSVTDRKLYRAGVSKSEIARRVQIGRTSVRRILANRSPG